MRYFNKAINQGKKEATEKRLEAIQVEIRTERAIIAQYIAHLITIFLHISLSWETCLWKEHLKYTVDLGILTVISIWGTKVYLIPEFV